MFRSIFVVGLLGFLFGCGNKGGLFLPKDATEVEFESAEEYESETESEDE